MHGTGNDFIIIDSALNLDMPADPGMLAQKLCRRHFSAGADGIILIQRNAFSENPKIQYYNSDGSMGEMCGNGARCAAMYLFRLDPKICKTVLMTDIGPLYCERLSSDRVSVCFSNINIPFSDREVTCSSGKYRASYAEIGGNGIPHLVLFSKELYSASKNELIGICRSLRHLEILPKGCNVNICSPVSADIINIKTYERGVEDFTLSCGSGAVAAACINYVNTGACSCNLNFDGGNLYVTVKSSGNNMSATLEGEACYVYSATI